MLHSLHADAFLSAFKCFTSRRGCPIRVYSDTGTNLVKGETELTKAFEHNKALLKQYSAFQGIEWHFIPPRSPHFGGVWERLVGIVK